MEPSDGRPQWPSVAILTRLASNASDGRRTDGQQIMHVATGNVLYLRFFGGKAGAPAFDRNATSKADVLKALSASFDFGEALIKEQSDESLRRIFAKRMSTC